jgi:ParB/RepB/Spo0J family partition protein
MSTTQLETPEVEIDKIDVDPEFNSREHFDPDELEALAETIKLVGLVQPIRLRPSCDGRFELVAGERRLRAARLAGLKKVPYGLSQGDPRGEAFFENHSRVDLNPIETALDIKAFAAEHGLTSNAKIAAKINPKKRKATERWIGDHLRLLNLPAVVQTYISSGDVPMAAEPKLRKIAAVSPEVAALICEVARRNEITGVRFLQGFGELLSQAAQAEINGKPTMISVRPCWLSEVIGDKAKHKGLAERINAVSDYAQEDPRVPFADAEVDAARAHGCLVEYQPNANAYYRPAFLTDRAFAEDLVERAVERREKEVEEAAQAKKEEKAKRKDERRKEREKQGSAGEETAHAKAKKRKAIARGFNDSLKRALLKKRTVARRKKFALARSKAVLVQLVADNPRLVAAGLRLVSDQLQDTKITALKNGATREKVTYASEQESTAELLRRALASTDPLEVIEVGAEALLAGLLADTEEVPKKDQVRWHSSVAKEIEKLLATEIREVRPRRVRKPN